MLAATLPQQQSELYLPDTYTLDHLHPKHNELSFVFQFVGWVQRGTPIQQGQTYVDDKGDRYLPGHHYRTAVAAAIDAGRHGLPLEERRLVVEAALLHDIGRLDPDIRPWADSTERYEGARRVEFLKVMSQHSLRGAEIALTFDWDTDEHRLAVAELIAAHHWPHYGVEPRTYPHLARMLSLADEFDALSSRRGYKPPHDEAETYDTLRREFPDHPQEVDVLFGYQASLN